MPTISPPTTAPTTESRPPRITTGNTLKPTRASWLSIPSIAPQTTPPSADTMPGHGPGEREIAPHVDPHCHRDLLTVGDRAHRNPDPALQEEPGEGGEKHDANSGPDELNRRQHDRTKQDRLVADRHHDRPGAGAKSQGRAAPQHRGEADRRHHDGDYRPPDQRAQHDALEPEADTTMPAIASSAQTQNGAPARSAAPAARKPANMTNSPWAKLIASVAL